jgi:DNA-binding PadR family transcriptional regulator
VAEESEPYGGRFAGRWVLQEAGRWEPGLRVLVSYGLLEKSGESTRGGRRAYYQMSDWREVRHALEELERLGLR